MTHSRSVVRPLHAALLFSLLGGALACSKAGQIAVPATESKAKVLPSEPYTEDLSPWDAALPPALVGSTGAAAVPQSTRRVGDRSVHRYSGAYRAQAIVLLEEVVGVDGELFVVDYKVLEGNPAEHLRVKMTMQSERIVSVERIIDGEPQATEIAAFDQLMERTSFAPDRNDGLVARKSETCLIGDQELECQVSRFDVEVDGDLATLKVARHPSLLRDLSGEVTAVDGTILYKADLLEFQRGPVASESEDTVALGDRPDWAEGQP